MRPSTQTYSITRSYILAFCDLFNDMYIVRYDEEGNEWKYEKTPVMFPFTEKWFAYQKNKWMSREDMDPTYLFEISKTLPLISIGEFKLSPNLNNQHNKYEKIKTANNKLTATPVSYFLDTTVVIYTNLLDDNYQLLEQILPYFAPSININVNIPNISENESVPITLTNISETIPVDIDVNTKKLVYTELSFKIKVNYYPDKMIDPSTYSTTISVE